MTLSWSDSNVFNIVYILQFYFQILQALNISLPFNEVVPRLEVLRLTFHFIFKAAKAKPILPLKGSYPFLQGGYVGDYLQLLESLHIIRRYDDACVLPHRKYLRDSKYKILALSKSHSSPRKALSRMEGISASSSAAVSFCRHLRASVLVCRSLNHVTIRC